MQPGLREDRGSSRWVSARGHYLDVCKVRSVPGPGGVRHLAVPGSWLRGEKAKHAVKWTVLRGCDAGVICPSRGSPHNHAAVHEQPDAHGPRNPDHYRLALHGPQNIRRARRLSSCIRCLGSETCLPLRSRTHTRAGRRNLLRLAVAIDETAKSGKTSRCDCPMRREIAVILSIYPSVVPRMLEIRGTRLTASRIHRVIR